MASDGRRQHSLAWRTVVARSVMKPRQGFRLVLMLTAIANPKVFDPSDSEQTLNDAGNRIDKRCTR
eukprot:8445589-Alexandrium_andersonii.AAC.1